MTCNTTPPDPNNEDPQDQGSRPKAGSSPNTATRLVSLVLRADAELFHDQRGTAYAALQIGGHRETLDLKFSGFRQWLARPVPPGVRGDPRPVGAGGRRAHARRPRRLRR